MKRTSSRVLVVLCLFACLASTSLYGEMLQNGNFNSPDNEEWTGTGWSSWGGPSGRPAWADQNGSGRGVAAYGWNDGSSLGFFQGVAGTSGVTYTFTIWVRKEVNYNECFSEIKLEFLDSQHTILSGTATNRITGQAGPGYTQFTVSGSTTNTTCVMVQPVVYTQWNTPTNTQSAAMQFDNATLVVEPGTVIMISQLPWITLGMMLSGSIVGTAVRKISRVHPTE